MAILLLLSLWFSVWHRTNAWLLLSNHRQTSPRPLLDRRLSQACFLAASIANTNASTAVSEVTAKEAAETSMKRKTKITSKKKDITTIARFWTNQTLTSASKTVHYNMQDEVIKVSFRIFGNPQPLQRHRQTRKGFVYNPSSAAQIEFLTRVQELVLLDAANLQIPLFPLPIPLKMDCIFALKRPVSDFVASKRGRPLKQSATTSTSMYPTTLPDVDNLAKFAMDSLNGYLYQDDKQIVILNAVKQRDNQGECWGYTEITVQPIMPLPNDEKSPKSSTL